MLPDQERSNGTEKHARGRFIVVGAGYGGLSAAIELATKGHDVEVIEAAKELSSKGDTVQIASYATKLMSRWGDVLEKTLKISPQYPEMTYWNSQGEKLLDTPLPLEIRGFPILFTNRALVQQFLYEHALSLGVQFQFGCRVSGYFETERTAGIITDHQQRLEADGIIAADGIHSVARGFVSKKTDQPKPSGGAIYRSWFPLELLDNEPSLKFLTESPRDEFHLWIGARIHIIVQTNSKLKGVVVLFNHPDTSGTVESWDNLGKLTDALNFVDGWDPRVTAIVRCIPKDKLIDWKLLWHDPARPWVSENGRILLIGDAAHPHLPTSGAGASQAMEDAATIGALVDIIGPQDLPLAFQTTEKLRYERTSLTQRLGWETRHLWHETDWDAVKKNPSILKFPIPDWLYGADATRYAYENAKAAIQSVQTGVPFISTNVPDGYVHEDWTAEDVRARQKAEGQEAFVIKRE